MLNINPIQRRQSALEKISQGLFMAKNAIGIGADVSTIKSHSDEKSDRERGVVNPEKALQYGDNYSYSPTKTDNSIPILLRINGQEQALYATPKNAGAKPLNQEQYLAQRKDGAQEVQPGTPGSILVSHVDAQGNTVQSYLMPPPPKVDKPTPDQSKASLFGRRMEQAEGVFSDLTQKGFDPTSLGSEAQRFSLFPERLKSENPKRQDQAERNFVNAVLRRESGSAIAPSEFSSAEKQYFPRAGDPPEVLKQKAENRKLATEGMRIEAGPAWASLPQSAGKISDSPQSRQKKGSNFSMIPDAMAGNSGKFVLEDLEMLKEVQTRLKKDPNDQKAMRALNILKGKGL